MRVRFAILIAAALVCNSGIAADGDALRSGPQAGSKLPESFHPVPLNFTNVDLPSYAGKRNDYVEQFGAAPVVLVFAREIHDGLTGLLKRLDAQVGETELARPKIALVMLSEDDELESTLREFGQEQRIMNISLAIASEAPKAYGLAREADVTVISYRRHVVQANHAFRKGELSQKAIGTLLADVSTLVTRPHVLADDEAKSMDLMVYAPTEIKWQDGPPSIPPGAKFAVLEGDPAKEGPFVMRLKFPDGYRIPPHTHPKPERLTVISGEFNIGMGGTFEKSKGRPMPAGSFGTWAAGMKHFVWTKGETVVQLHGTGPWSIEYVNPSDDPQKSKR